MSPTAAKDVNNTFTLFFYDLNSKVRVQLTAEEINKPKESLSPLLITVQNIVLDPENTV